MPIFNLMKLSEFVGFCYFGNRRSNEYLNMRIKKMRNQRGLFIRKNGDPLELKGIFYGRSLSSD